MKQAYSSAVDNLLDSEMAYESQTPSNSEYISEQNSLLDFEISSPSWDDLIDFIIDAD